MKNGNESFTSRYMGFPLKESLRVGSVYSTFYSDLSRNYISVGESHDFWELFYLENGRIGTSFNNNCFEMKSDDFMVYAPNQYHRHTVLDDKNARIIVISFQLEFCPENMLKIVNEPRPLTAPLQEMLRRTMQYSSFIFQSIEDSETLYRQIPYEHYDPLYEQLLRNELEQLLLNLMLLLQTKQLHPYSVDMDTKRSSQAITDRICTYMKNHLYQKITLEEISNNFCCGKTMLCRIFQEVMGTTPIRFFQQLKIDHSKMLLASSAMSITEIAGLLNFSTPHHFSNAFYKATGLYPSQYRKSIVKDMPVIMMRR